MSCWHRAVLFLAGGSDFQLEVIYKQGNVSFTPPYCQHEPRLRLDIDTLKLAEAGIARRFCCLHDENPVRADRHDQSTAFGDVLKENRYAWRRPHSWSADHGKRRTFEAQFCLHCSVTVGGVRVCRNFAEQPPYLRV